MQVGAIGGPVAMGAAAALGGVSSTGSGSLTGQVVPGSAPPPTTVGEALAQSIHGGMEQLTELLEGFSIAEILFALMLLAATDKDEDKSGSGAALGLLAGLAIAGQLGQSTGFELHLPVQDISVAGGLGSNINFTA